MIDKNKIKRIERKTKYLVPISIRISEKHNKWLKDEGISPTALFLEASKELGYKANGKK